MRTSFCGLLIPALLLGWLGLASPAAAAFKVKDEGKFFSKDAIEKANEKIAQIKRDYNEDLAIETYDSVPEKYSDEAKEKSTRAKAFDKWARARYKDLGVQGIYVLICKSPQRIEPAVGKRTKEKAFTTADQKKA